MRVVGLLSGGKDSCYNLCHAVKQGHDIVALATLAPPEGKDEIDSYMYQTVGHDAVHLVAQAMGVPLYRRIISGSAVHQGSGYGARLPGGKAPSSSDETEDLLELLLETKRNHPDLEAVSVGAILSNYQRVRVEHVSLRAGLKLLPLAYLWQRDQSELLAEMCQAGIEAVLIKVAGIGLDERCLGRTLAQMRPKLEDLNRRFGAHVCGEGGEYETLTLDSPLHKQRIVLDDVEVVVHSDASFASVSYLRIKKAHLEDKGKGGTTLEDVKVPPLLDAMGLATEANARDASLASTSNSQPGPSRLPSDSPAAPCLTTRDGVFGAAGIIADDPEPSKAFVAAFETLQATLAQHDLTLADVSHLNVYLSSQADFSPLNAVYSSLFASEPPSRACIALGPGAPRIAIDAFGDAKASRTPERRKVVHVQGRSYWAAANIGPYSQAVVARSRICISGQIGLRPDTLTLAQDEATQMALSLQHARRILDVAAPAPPSSGGTVKARSTAFVEGCVCWIDGGGSRALLDPRLAAARAAWQTQRRPIVEAEDDDDEDDDERESWLGPNAQDLPTVYAVLPAECLPRGAVVEWQMTAHEGIASPDVRGDEDDDEDEKPRSEWRKIKSGNAGGWSWTVSTMTRPLEPSTFGIACSRDAQGSTGAAAQGSELSSLISTSALVRVLYDATQFDESKVRSSVEKLLSPSGAAVSYLGLDALFDANGQAVPLTIVWQGV